MNVATRAWRDCGDRTLAALRGGHRRGLRANAVIATFDSDGRFAAFVPVHFDPSRTPSLLEPGTVGT